MSETDTVYTTMATLAWCNERRAEQGKEPLAELPTGVISDALSCPCGEATGLWVGGTTWGIPNPDNRFDYPRVSHVLPEAVQHFVHLFDSGYYPELIRHEED